MVKARDDAHVESTAVMRSEQLEDLLEVEDEHSSHTLPIEASQLEALLGDAAPAARGPKFAPLVPRATDDELDGDATLIDGQVPGDEVALADGDADEALEAVSTAAIDAGQLAKLLES